MMKRTCGVVCFGLHSRYANNQKLNPPRRHLRGLRTSSKPSVAIVGSGAVGCYYGSRLWETNKYDVKFFMRGDHYDTSKQLGLNVTSVHGDIFIPPDRLQAYDDTRDIGPVDWVIVALKSTALDAMRDGYKPREKPVFQLAGGDAHQEMAEFLEKGKAKGHFFDHDVTVALAIAEIMTGGPDGAAETLDEQAMFDRERASFLKLAKTQETRARIVSLLRDGVSLRN